ncbi:MAG: hypothetical protein AUI59_03185 [Thaumarchaeota archaeon 13_1_40CM_2_39_13_1]|nr:MAG: hypothetical protein AUI59_03185 [Thaumarchaeota archaeon 13_1_40CM_2_39_13_1]
MSKMEPQSGKFLDELKSNYRQRTQEVDAFSKRFSSIASDFRSQYLSGMLDILDYYIDLQKKFLGGLPTWYDNNLMIRQSKVNTETWTQAVRNLDSYYSKFVEYSIKNMRLFNQGWIQMMQSSEMLYDMYKNVPQIQRNALLEAVAHARRYSDTSLQKQLPMKKWVSSSHNRTRKNKPQQKN